MNRAVIRSRYAGRRIRDSRGRTVFRIVNLAVLAMLTLLCLLPFVNVIAMSLSKNVYVMAGQVSLWPKGFNLSSYAYMLNRPAFWSAFRVSVVRLALGSAINLALIILTAYPLSRDDTRLAGRTFYAWFFFITMLVGGGMIPSYILVSSLKLRNSIWALVLPGALPVFNLVLMLNFFRQVPRELEEASMIDGAGHLRTLVQIYLPVSLPAIATIALFCMVGHWNAWFDGMIYMTQPDKIPLQTYLRGIIIDLDIAEMSGDDWAAFQEISDRTLKCAQIVVATLPILAVYPFLQRYFVSGIVLGSVKG